MLLRGLFLSVLIASAAVVSAAELIVSNYGGNTVSRFSLTDGSFLGDFSGGSLNGTLASHVGPDGNLYVASENTNSVLKYSLSTHTYLGIAASGAGLNGPNGFAFDGSGNMLVGNFNDSSVAKFSPTGAYLGKLVNNGDGGLSSADIGTTVRKGVLYVPSFYTNAILKYDASTGASLGAFVAPGSGGLSHPRGLAFHDQAAYVTSENGNSVLKYGLDGSFLGTFVSPGSGGLSGAAGIAFGGDGYLYLSSWRNGRVLRYSETTGAFVGTFASGLNGPVALTVVPEPATLCALGVGIVALTRRRKG